MEGEKEIKLSKYENFYNIARRIEARKRMILCTKVLIMFLVCVSVVEKLNFIEFIKDIILDDQKLIYKGLLYTLVMITTLFTTHKTLAILEFYLSICMKNPTFGNEEEPEES